MSALHRLEGDVISALCDLFQKFDLIANSYNLPSDAIQRLLNDRDMSDLAGKYDDWRKAWFKL